MDRFNGFSQDEINRVTGGDKKISKAEAALKIRSQHMGIRRMPDKNIIANNHNNNNRPKPLVKKAPLMSQRALATKTAASATGNAENSAPDAVDCAPRQEDKALEPRIRKGSVPNGPQDEGGESIESPFRGVSLQEFETHRKMIEEQNRQKKQLLCQAIEHHSQKTAAETRKIEEIKSELAKLDNDLAVDVAILRKQIDAACLHFTNIEKHYIKIEAQFLKAKMELHQAAEKKELLTEHLCTVIAHNEDRKAEKLSELMQKVGLSPSGDLEAIVDN